MRALVVYESIYGNTHTIANAIAEGLRPAAEVRVLPAGEADAREIAWADLLVVGGPTHVHGMTRQKTREAAIEAISKPEGNLDLDMHASGPGVREWLDRLSAVDGKRGAAFDTRINVAALLSGRASIGIAKGLRHHGVTLVVDPESFLITRKNVLIPGEIERATRWGAGLVEEPASAG